MAVVASLLPDPVRVARLSAALRDQYLTMACDSWPHLFRTVDRHPVSVAVVDPRCSPDSETATESLRSLRRSYGSLAIVAYVASPPVTEYDVFEFGRLGLDAIAFLDRSDSPRLLRATIERAEARGLLEPIRKRLGDVNPTVRDAVLMVISRAQQRLSPEAMARAMGISRGYLAAQLTAAGFPTPHLLIGWGRMIVASRMLEDERRSGNAVSAALEFPSASAFRNACQRYLGAAPAEIRERGGARYAVSQLFVAAGRDGASAAESRTATPRDAAVITRALASLG